MYVREDIKLNIKIVSFLNVCRCSAAMNYLCQSTIALICLFWSVKLAIFTHAVL